MAWRGRLEEAGDSGLELSLGLPAYFAKPSGLDAGEEPGDAAAFALQAAKGSDGSKTRLVPKPLISALFLKKKCQILMVA
jgi:auxin-responsive protein IAA